MSVNSKLIPISYFSPKQSIRLNAYADTIIYEPDGRRQILRAIRFGGYPEMVRALADALYAGADLEATIMAKTSATDTSCRFICIPPISFIAAFLVYPNDGHISMVSPAWTT